MTPFSLLSLYTSKLFLKCFGAMALGLYIIIFIFDFAELQRQTSLKDMAFLTKIEMVCLRTPVFLEQALPFLVFIAALFMFWRMSRSCELIIFRSMGVSLWRVIFPISLTALSIGWLDLTVLNSLSSTMLSRYGQFEKKYLSRVQGDIAIESTGIWLSDYINGYQIIYRASQICLNPLEFSDINVVVLSPQDKFLERIDAKKAQIQGNKLHFKTGWKTVAGKGPQAFSQETMETSLNRSKIEKMKLKANTSSFWNLPAYISLLEMSGLKSLRYQMYWHFLLAQSFWPGAMVLLAAAFACRPLRQGKTLLMILTGLTCGFLLYFFKDIMFSFGISGRFPPIIAAWLPALLTLMVGSIVVFNQEDG